LHSEEDNQQYLEFLKLKYGEDKAEYLFNISIKRRQRKELKVKKAERTYAEIKANYIHPYNNTDLAAIIFPESTKLDSIPIFKRYAAYLFYTYGVIETEKILNLSRITIWRYLNRI